MVKLIEPALFRFLGWNTQGDLGPFTFYTSKRNGLVWYPRSPPTQGPTPLQLLQRNRWTAAAEAWSALPPATRALWTAAAHRSYLRISGINLWMYWHLTQDDAAIRTVERQSGITLLAP